MEEDCASYGRLAWAAKDKIVEALSEGAPLTKRAPRYPTMLLAKIERYILDAILPTALAGIGVPAEVGRWRLEGSDVYARSYGGRVAKLQRSYAETACRMDTRYVELDEQEIGETLADWLVERGGLRPDMNGQGAS